MGHKIRRLLKYPFSALEAVLRWGLDNLFDNPSQNLKPGCQTLITKLSFSHNIYQEDGLSKSVLTESLCDLSKNYLANIFCLIYNPFKV